MSVAETVKRAVLCAGIFAFLTNAERERVLEHFDVQKLEDAVNDPLRALQDSDATAEEGLQAIITILKEAVPEAVKQPSVG